jgi:hypothetical protein
VQVRQQEVFWLRSLAARSPGRSRRVRQRQRRRRGGSFMVVSPLGVRRCRRLLRGQHDNYTKLKRGTSAMLATCLKISGCTCS